MPGAKERIPILLGGTIPLALKILLREQVANRLRFPSGTAAEHGLRAYAGHQESETVGRRP
jgi:hypothetical protein